MDANQQQEESIFAAARELTDPAERRALLDRACAGEPALRQRLEKMLAALADADDFFLEGELAVHSAIRTSETPAEQLGQRIGRYKLLEKIGEGGCGVVYMAEQQEPVRRRVALKVIKVGMDTRNVIARFEAERQALAMMDHPNIAKVLDAGATEMGRPFFVMELVRGIRITQYCEENELPIQDRLELFLQVCQAVQHAHQKGVIHRDLKPSNILVTVNDGVAVPKVIDFGIAKATAEPLTEKTLFTAFAQLLGTPAYMSPEQATMTSVDIDTRSDIYSLGVLLYELLTAETPFDTQQLLRMGWEELRRTICEREPMRPSTRLTQAPGASDARRLRPKSPITNRKSQIDLVRGDLDWIVMKCLEKDRARRYETANGLAMDIQRLLNDEPIVARPPSNLYRFQKLVRRHRVAFAGAVVVLAVLVLGVLASTWEAARARRAEHGQSRLREQAQQAQAKAEAQAYAAEAQAYVSDMNLVQQAWEGGNLRRAQALLRAYNPKPGEPDLRGFEWRYLWKLCRDESGFSFTNFPAGVVLAPSPDGSFVAASSRHLVRLLDYANRHEIETLLDPNDTDTITALAFSPAATNILATGTANHIKLWNLTTRQVVATLAGHLAANKALAFSQDGKLLAATGGNDPTLELWDVEARKLVWTRKASLYMFAVAFTPDGKSLVSSGGESLNPLLWDLVTGTPSAFPVEHKASINSFDFSPDGRLLAATANDSTVILWNFAERRPVARLFGHNGAVESARFSPDGRYLVTGSEDATVRLWAVASGEQKAIYRGHQAGVSSVAFSRDGRLLISGSFDRTVKIWEVDAPRREEVLQAHKGWAGSVEFSPDGNRVASVGLHEGVLTIWDVATRSRVADLPGSSMRTPAAAFSPNGETIALVGEDRLIRLWDAATLAPRSFLTNDFDMFSLSFSPDSRILAVAGLPGFALQGITNRLAFWDLARRRKMDKLAAAGALAAVASFSHDGRLVAVGYLDGRVEIWDFGTEHVVAEFKEQSVRIWSIAFSPDDTWLAAGGGDGALVFYDTHSPRAFKPLTESSWWVVHLAFAPDGKTLASAEGDGTVKLLNVATRRSALTLKGYVGEVSGVAFSPDGKLLASCGADGTVRFWLAPAISEIP